MGQGFKRGSGHIGWVRALWEGQGIVGGSGLCGWVRALWVGQVTARHINRQDTKKKKREFLIPYYKAIQLVLLFWSITARYDQSCHK